MRDEPLERPVGRQEGCRQKKGLGGEGVAASSCGRWGAASLPPPVWASEGSRGSRPFRSTPGDNATPTGFPGVVRRVDLLSLDPLAVWLRDLPRGPLRSLRPRVPAPSFSPRSLADSLPTASSWIIRDVQGTKVADIRMKGVDQ
jgi:hypothetical protein